MADPANSERLFHPREGEDAPAFDAPWQAELLGLAYALAERGAFTRSEWSQALGASLQAAVAAGKADTDATYFECALGALEGLLAQSGDVTAEAVNRRTEAWRDAYVATPHGEPVLLKH